MIVFALRHPCAGIFVAVHCAFSFCLHSTGILLLFGVCSFVLLLHGFESFHLLLEFRRRFKFDVELFGNLIQSKADLSTVSLLALENLKDLLLDIDLWLQINFSCQLFVHDLELRTESL